MGISGVRAFHAEEKALRATVPGLFEEQQRDHCGWNNLHL